MDRRRSIRLANEEQDEAVDAVVGEFNLDRAEVIAAFTAQADASASRSGASCRWQRHYYGYRNTAARWRRAISEGDVTLLWGPNTGSLYLMPSL